VKNLTAKYLKPGTIITIGRSTQEYVVVSNKVDVSHDTPRGDSYSFETLEAIAVNPVALLNAQLMGDEVELQCPVKQFYFADGSMKGAGKAIRHDSVKVKGSHRLKREVTVKYVLSERN